jgi:hypothetical protein
VGIGLGDQTEVDRPTRKSKACESAGFISTADKIVKADSNSRIPMMVKTITYKVRARIWYKKRVRIRRGRKTYVARIWAKKWVTYTVTRRIGRKKRKQPPPPPPPPFPDQQYTSLFELCMMFKHTVKAQFVKITTPWFRGRAPIDKAQELLHKFARASDQALADLTGPSKYWRVMPMFLVRFEPKTKTVLISTTYKMLEKSKALTEEIYGEIDWPEP